ncbi:murein hydrolase activator EnvC family protein [Bacillus taeanensis]|uniref:Peptidase M23 n=1 Tax=Bacillus taeanensis TaxID=273032 RepID=A0A366Y2F7_9BACI|nr:M23 family metallopeptidase [Bacillus taeanensis]RBW71179.1 peptidase M23 [Bacillus taeanensis]
MKRKAAVITLTAALTFSGVLPIGDVRSAAAASIDQKIEEVQKQQEQNQQEQQQSKEEITKIQEEQEHVESEIKRLDTAVMDTNDKLDKKQAEIDETNQHIEELKQEITILKERIAERDALLKDRVRAMYENGAVSYLDVLLGAKDFGDFVERVSALNVIAEQDRTILEEHKADKLSLEEKKVEVEEELAALEVKLKELEGLKQQLNSQMAEKQTLMESLEKQEGELHSHVEELENAEQLLAAQEAAFKEEKAEAERLAREEAERRAREEAAARAASEEAAKQQSSSNTSNASNSQSSSNTSSTPAPAPKPSGSSTFIWPANGYVSSGYGSRWGTLHAGADIAAGGTVPIVAAAGGTVIRAEYSSSYGNVVYIAHNINGQNYTTVYAHMRSLNVSYGQRVSQGQMLGYMGNTGNSYGQHLHFELHLGGWNAAKSNSVDPLRYLP